MNRLRVPAGRSVALDDPAIELSVILDGAFAVESRHSRGRRVTLEIVGRGACVPADGGTSGYAPRSGGESLTLRAMCPAVVARVPRACVARCIERQPRLASLIAAKMAANHRSLIDRLAMLAEPNPRAKVAAAVLYLGRNLGLTCSLAEGLRVEVSQAVVADVADVARQTANRFLGEFQDLGMLRIERAMLCLRDPAGLAGIASGARPVRAWKACGPCALLNRGVPLTCFPLVSARR